MASQKARVLVADDSATISSLVSDVLSAEGYSVDVAPTGTAAWEKLTRQRYDIVLCDVVLPEIDGPSLYRRLRDDKSGPFPRFVFISGYGHQHLARMLQETGAPLLGKPFKVSDLIAIIGEANPVRS